MVFQVLIMYFGPICTYEVFRTMYPSAHSEDHSLKGVVKRTQRGLSSALLLLPQEKLAILVAKQIQNYLEIKDCSRKGLFH